MAAGVPYPSYIYIHSAAPERDRPARYVRARRPVPRDEQDWDTRSSTGTVGSNDDRDPRTTMDQHFDVRALQEALKDAQSRVRELSRENHDLNDSLRAANKENRRSKKERQDLSAQTTDLREKNEQYRDAYRRKANALKRAEVENQELRDQLDQTKDENRRLRDKSKLDPRRPTTTTTAAAVASQSRYTAPDPPLPLKDARRRRASVSFDPTPRYISGDVPRRSPPIQPEYFDHYVADDGHYHLRPVS